MSRVQLSGEAETDHVEIWTFVARDSAASADTLLSRIHDTCHALAVAPGIGRDRADLVRGLRSFPVGSFLIFYRRARDGIEIARVLSGFRDLPALFE